MSRKIILGSSMNNVILKFSTGSNAGVHPVLHYFLTKLINTEYEDFMNPGKFYKLVSLHISSTSEPYEKHAVGGPHRNGLAVDISKINGKGITEYYNRDEELTGICDAIQVAATDHTEVFENFGPLICFKTNRRGQINQIEKDKALINQHKTHLHFSVRA